jgi:hypothetical protein
MDVRPEDSEVLDRLVGLVARGARLEPAAARQATAATLVALARALPPFAASPLAGLVDAARREAEAAASQGPAAAIEWALGLSPDRARDLADTIIVAALEALGPDAATVHAALPEALRPAPAIVRPDVVHAHAAPPARDTLASGRPGSAHPLADARPEPAHEHSIARADDPHADRRLSSAHGETTRGHTLADGRAPRS